MYLKKFKRTNWGLWYSETNSGFLSITDRGTFVEAWEYNRNILKPFSDGRYKLFKAGQLEAAARWLLTENIMAMAVL